ncbi:MAG TPA: carboxypeptidase regulatory-like domain-containing protein [Thermoanaerobaculia bacterium]|nr:carboxypeptidase regulatory-like domain-containing protein [Thermoanaerobaculia bacterium]
MRLRQTRIGAFLLVLALAAPLSAGEVAKADLDILGLGLEVDRNPVTTAVDVPAYVQTLFGGKTGDDAPPAPGLSALGELTGPGITTPITLATTPGRLFALPALHEKGEYALQNIRLVGANGEFLQQAVPSFAIINVTDVLKTEVRVRQLSPEELRQRGIVIDSRNYDVYEYTFVFGVDQSTVEIPYPVIIDKRTHQVVPVPRESPYSIPPIPQNQKPPRFVPPAIEPFELGPGGPSEGGGPPDGGGGGERPSIPAALVVPTGFGVLHQFFAVILQVDNGAPEGSNIRLDSVTATINAPTQLRVSKVIPAVSIGQPVPITDEKTGATFLVAGGRGNAEWTLEALKAGTHTVNVEVNATYQKPGQADFPLRGRVSTSLVVSDPRFQINFSHPDTVRKDEKYTAYAFVTNLSPQQQTVSLDLSYIPLCSSGASADNICRDEGTPATKELTIPPGGMVPVPYKLNSKISGKIFAAAGVANDEGIVATVKLTMGVSTSGIPLSPATLVMPYYARFLPSEFIDANMQLLGLGYSLSTAPLNNQTAAFPRVIKTDVFTRAQQIARAGQRIFIARKNRDASDPLENREPFFHLALDLLGNTERMDQSNTTPEMREWDDLRQAEEAGRRAGAAMARQLEIQAFSAGETPRQFVDEFAAATSHRTGYLFAYAHGAPVSGVARPYAISVDSLSGSLRLAEIAETCRSPHEPVTEAPLCVRSFPYSELTQLNAGGDHGELALIGQWRQGDIRVKVLPATDRFTLHLIYPEADGSALLRTDIDVINATAGRAVEIVVRRGQKTLIVDNATATPLVDTIPQTALRVIGAAQDLHLDEHGHLVSMLFNRPVKVADAAALRDRFALTMNVPKASYTVTRKNNPSDPNALLQIPGAALQADAKIINISFDKTLSRNAEYKIAVESILDLTTEAAPPFAKSDIVPRIDNDRPGGILTGRVLRGDNSAVPNVLVRLLSNGTTQIDPTGSDGRFLYEFVPRDIDSGLFGNYKLSAEAEGKKAELEGAVRLPGEVHTVNLQFLGRGVARGQVRYHDGEVIPDVVVTIGSTMFDQARRGTTDASGNYEIGDLPVGPLTFSVNDKDGRPTYAANQIRVAGEVVTQDLVIVRREAPGLGNVRVTVRRSDTNAIVSGALVGVWAQGYALRDGYTSTDGSLTFSDIPAGIVSVLAADFSLSREAAGVEVELRADQTLEQTLVLSIPQPNVKYATLTGIVKRDDPAAPGDTTKDQIAPGAIVTIDRMPAVTADADGRYTFTDLTLDVADRRFTVFDPVTGRRGYFSVPTLVEGSNEFNPRLRSTQPAGIATMRVRVYGSQGEPVTGYRVIWPGYPPTAFAAKGNGVYELPDMRVPQQIDVVAVPPSSAGHAVYGQQVASGYVRVDFHGQIGVTDLRLPGSGTVVVRVEVEQSCSTPPCGYAPAIGPVALSYAVWDEAEQGMRGVTIEGTPDPNTGLVTFTKVPARQNLGVATARNPLGYAATSAYLSYDGDVRNVTLRLKTIGDVTGRVYAHDGVTPISGATVRIYNNRATYPPAITNPDGTFRFAGFPAGTSFSVVADLDRDGVYRTGIVGGQSPSGGGPVSNLIIVMRTQSTVEGQVLDGVSGLKVPLARYWLRELAWPYRSIGTPQDPLFADINGRFIVSNVFTGEFRITAVSPDNQEIRGDYQGVLREEGDATQRSIQVHIGGAGSGAVSVTVVDPLLGFSKVANAEVALLKGSQRFDFTSTNDSGVAFFDSVPVGRYTIVAYSKAAGRAGHAVAFDVFNGSTTPVTVQLEFRGYVSGTLTDPESEPAPGLPVKGMPVQMQATGISAADSTDIDGFFEFNGVPEGSFSLSAFEIGTHRRAVGPTNLYIDRLVPERTGIKLELERTATLTVKVFLPNDTGGAGELAPLVEVTVWQGNLIYGPVPYYRGQQGNPVVFRKMLAGMGYGIEVRELGGEQRVVRTGGGFGGALTKEHHVTLPTSGTVEVRVVDAAGVAVQDAKVNINSSGLGTRTMYTPASGSVTLPGVPFGWVSASATKGNVSASGGGSLASRSQTLVIPLNLGSNATVEGGVDAEIGDGSPSVATRVLLNVTTSLSSAIRLETLTDSAGNYRFTGIPIGNTTLTLTFYGPDDTTIGATRTVPVANGTTGVITIPRVRIDATPPRVLSIDPPANATSVSPSTAITIVFSEQIASGYLNTGWFQLIATDNSSFVNSAIEPSVRPDGTFIVRLIPPPPPAGQKFPLKSNVIYRINLPQGIRDTTGNSMTSPVGSSFTTVNYTEPAIVKIEPLEKDPIPASATFRIKFNKFISPTSFDAGAGGVVLLERLDAYQGTAVETIPIAKFLDPADASTLIVSPQGVAIAESSFYRLTVGGARDTQTPPNVQKAPPRVFEFFSFDTKKPVAKITSSETTLVSALLYSATVSVTDEGTTNESNDIAYVDWLDANGSAIARSSTKPFSYSFAAPATTTATTFTLKAVATDLSGNSSPEPDVHTWNVAPNEAPREIVVTNTPASAYPTHWVQTRVSFKDEGVSVNVALELRGTYVDGSPLTKVLGSKNVTRASASVAFADAVFDYVLPEELRDGAAKIVANVTDSVNKVGTAEAPLTIHADTTAPQLVAFLPAAESRYKFNTAAGSYTIEVKAKDAETGLSRAVISVGGVEQSGVTSTFDGSTGITTWRRTITVPPRNADTRIAIAASVYDKRNNVTTDTHEVIYERVDDATLPTAAWITPLDGAALPSNISGWQATLRVKATDDVKVMSVRFESTALSAPLNASLKAGTTDIYEAKASFNFPADKLPFVIKAIVTDADPLHDVELPITVDPVEVDSVITGDINITSITAAQYANKSVAVRVAWLWVSVPLVVKDLILLDGAGLGSAQETKVDLTITDHLFVDGDSRVFVNGRGYLGGWRARDDGGFTNGSLTGRTAGGTTTGGAVYASASHAGFGGSFYGATNATYGSITSPTELGSGGAAETVNNKGGNGGGAVALRGGSGLARFVIAGPVSANGDSWWSSGSGGSLLLDARAIITGPVTRITANGGDTWGSYELDRGGGGGRVSIRARERLDMNPAAPVIQARGGRNGNNAEEGATYVDGGAGTIYLARPGSTLGELIVSSFDEAHPATTHRTAATPLSGSLAFDAITIGPRTLARFDTDGVTPATVDPTATVLTPADVPTVSIVSTTPAAGGSTAQNTTITARFDAASTVGLRSVRTILSVQPNDVVTFPRWAPLLSDNAIAIAVPSSATPGTTTLKIQVTDRAGRVAESAPVSFTIINNAPVVIESFDVTPATETYANRTISVSATASDDIAVQSLSLTSSIGSVSSGTATKPTSTTMARSFTVSIPATAPSNSDVVLTLSAVDDVPGRVPTTATHTVKLLKDEIAPSITVTKPTANQEILEGTGATFDVEANVTDAEVAVKSVTATFEGVTKTMSLVSGTLYRANFAVPSVEGSELIAKTITVNASDYDNNLATRDVHIFIKPLVDPNAPALSWVCASPGAMFPTGYEFTMRLSAVPSSGSNGVSSVVATIDGASSTINATREGTSNIYAFKYTIPAGTADGTVLNVRVVVRSVGSNESTLLGTVTAVAGQIDLSTQSNVIPLDPGYQDRHVVVRSGGILVLNGEQHLRNLVVLEGGKVIQKHPDNANASLVTVDRLFVACSATIDVTGQGFAPRTTYPGETPSAANSGGSHIGVGGARGLPGTSYGSVYRPREAGGGEHYRAFGGGVVRIAAARVVLDGVIYADGQSNGNAHEGSAAGGSVWIQSESIRGTGRIEADGGNGAAFSSTNGGGGAIAIEYSDPASIVPALQAWSGNHYNPYAGAGSIYTKGPQSTFGDLRFDNTGRPHERPALLPALGTHIIESVPTPGTIVLQSSAAIQPYFAGHYLRVHAPDGGIRGIWRIATVATPSQLVLESSSEPFDVHAGDSVRGAYRFDSLTLRNAWVETSDLVLLGKPPVLDASSIFRPGNDSAPVVNSSLVTFAKGAYGTLLTGAANAFTDPDKPVDVWVRSSTSDDLTPATVTFGTTGGLSIRKISNGQEWSSALSKRGAAHSAYLSCRVSQTNNHVDCGMRAADWSRFYTWGIFNNGTWQIWINNSPTSITGTYSTSSVFRIEKTPGLVRWFLNGTKVHELAVDGSVLYPQFAIRYDGGEINSIHFSVDSNVSKRAAVANDGSFSIGVDGAAGDAVILNARDSHYFALQSQTAVGSIPDDFGIAAITFNPSPVTGGRTSVGTVTLRSAASSSAAIVMLQSDNTTAATVPVSVTIPSGQTSATFNITTAPAQGSTPVNISATWGGVATTAVLAIEKDTIAPAVSITAPAANAEFTEGSSNKIPVQVTVVDDDSGVARVYATIDGQNTELAKNTSLGANVWTGNVPAPFVDGTQNVARDLLFTALDRNDNSGTATVSVQIKPVVDGGVPAISWSCTSANPVYPVGYGARLKVVAKAPNATNPLQKIEFLVTDAGGASTTYTGASIGSDLYEYIFTIPDVADGTHYTLRAIATTAAGTTALVDGAFTVLEGGVEIRTNTTIGASDTSYDNKNIVVWDGVTVTIAGQHTFKRLAALNNSVVTHPGGDRLHVNVEQLYVACGAAIDANGRGYGGNSTYPGETTSADGTGGSHMGQGGLYSNPIGSTYGSVYTPMEAGGGGDNQGGGGAGGGVVRITAGSIAVDGTIRANGANSGEAGGGGGSVWITTGKISGTGSVEANGGPNFYGEGGGGAVSVEYSDATSSLPLLRAHTGIPIDQYRPGGAGTIYVKRPGSTYGDLTIDNAGHWGQATVLPSLGNGSAQAGTSNATLITDRPTNIPTYFVGHWVEITSASGSVKGTWRIASVNGKSATLANGSETIALAAGDLWRGVYRFDTILLRYAKAQSLDAIRYATLDKDSGSTLTSNASAPLFAQDKLAQIVVESTPDKDYVAAPAGTVSDPDTPIRMTATNVRTAAQYTGNANADGSFKVAVAGLAGDTFTVKATDSHALPLSSPHLPVSGAIVETNGVTSLSISPTTVAAGNVATGTVQLVRPARAEGTVVALTSSSPAAVVPATIAVAGGQTSAQFSITTPASPAGDTVTITASTAAGARSATLTILSSGDYVTTVAGRVVDERARGVAALTVTCATHTGTTDADGFFSISDMPAAGNITCTATQSLADGTTYSGTSAPTPAVADSVTNVGDIVIRTTISFTQLSASSWGVGSSFRARTIKRHGKTLVVSGAGGGPGTGDNDRIAIFDLTNPASPSFVRQVSAGNTAIYDVEIVDGWGYVTSWDFCTINLASPTSSKICYGTVGSLTVAVMNKYAFVATNSNYKIKVYDVTNPAAAKNLRDQDIIPGTGSQKFFWDLIPIGSGHLAGLSFTSENGVGHDLVMLDVRDVNNFVKVADIDLPNFTAVRGHVDGSILYISSASEVAAFDVSNPAAPVLVSRTAINGGSDNVFVAGKEAYATAGASGLAQIDVAVPASPFVVKHIGGVGGSARDLLFYSNYVYVANDTGLAYARMPVAPQVSPSHIKLARATPNVTVTGLATSVTGATPITVMITNRTSGATAPGFAVNADGSFSASLAAASGDRIAITAIDVAGRESAMTDAGLVPFGTSVEENFLATGTNYRARTVRTDGSLLGVARWGGEGEGMGQNTLMFVFDISTPGSTTYKYGLDAVYGNTYDFDIFNGWAYTSGWDVCTIDLRSSTSTRRCVGTGDAGEVGMAYAGGTYAFATTGWQNNDGRIRIYNVSNPNAPSLLRHQSTTVSTEFYDSIPYGDNHLVAIERSVHDVVVFNRTDVNNLVKLADIDIPNFESFRGHIDGNLLYIAGFGGKVAIVDLTNPAAPVVKSILSTGVAKGVTASSNRAVVAAGMLGVVYLDVTNPAAPVILGRQQISGNAWDVLLRNGVLYVANEQGLLVIKDAIPVNPNTSAPQFPLAAQITAGTDASGDFVAGPAGAVTDPDTPIDLRVTSARTGQMFNGTALPDGSFRIPVVGQGGDTFTIQATDSHATPLSATIAVNGSIVDANQLASIAIEPSSVAAGASTIGTVRLLQPARSNGISVALASSHPSATVSSAVIISAGESSAQFAITTLASSANAAATITATYQRSKSATLDIAGSAGALASVTLDASTVEGGTSLNGTVTLGGPAPAGGATVLLASSYSSVASVPSSIVIPEGVTTETFTVGTKRVAATTSASISATYGATRSAALNLTACTTLGTAARPATVPSPLWLDDAPPSGGTPAGSAAFDATQAASGTQALHFDAASGARSWSVTGAAPLAVTPDDKLVVHVLVNPCNPARELWITLSDGTTSLDAMWGESLIDPRGKPVRIGPMPRGGEWVRLEVPASILGLTSAKNFTSMEVQVYGGEAWIDAVGLASCVLPTAAAPSHRSDEEVWFDDALPAGAVASSGGNARPWLWDTTQAASGTKSHTELLEAGWKQHSFSGATEKLNVAAGDALYVWVLLDPCNPPRQILITFAKGGDVMRGAFWGEKLILPGATIPQTSRIGVMPEAGRWVRLEIPAGLINAEGIAMDGMALATYGGRAWFDRAGRMPRVNLARGKVASQSSTVTNNGITYGASRVVDGDTSGVNDNWCTTNFESEPWWQVDLGAVQSIEDIQIWPRPNCCAPSDFTVYVSDTPFASTRAGIEVQSGVARLAIIGTASRPMSLRVDRTGRYVRLYRNGTAELQLGEVEVWAPASAKRVNLAIGRTSARQSSTQSSNPSLARAEHAVNGDLSGSYGSLGSTTHTNLEANAWWDVDLGSVLPISAVDVFMRFSTDPNPVAPGDEITNFYVFVSDGPFASSDPAATISQPGVSTYFYGSPPRSSHPFVIDRPGRYVRVQISNTWVLFLNEVQIWSQDALLEALSKKELH